jgi:hypothetical protein
VQSLLFAAALVADAVPVQQQPGLLYTALIAAVGALISPWVNSWMTNRNLAKVKTADWARQDAVASQAAETARLLLERQDMVAERAAKVAEVLLMSNRKQEQVAQNQGAQLKQIHKLVNSGMTAQITDTLNATEDTLDATETVLVLLIELQDTRKAAGQESSPEAVAKIAATKIRVGKLTERVGKLTEELAKRKVETEEASRQLAVDIARPLAAAAPADVEDDDEVPQPPPAPRRAAKKPPQDVLDGAAAESGDTIARIVKA